MIAYLILLFVVVLIAYLSRLGSRGIQWLGASCITLILTLFAGLRYRLVGTDTSNYVRIFENVESIDDIWRSTEIGFNALMLVAKSLSTNYISLLLIIALVTVSLYIFTIMRQAKHYEIAIFLFITLGAYTFFFNGARQGIAAAICFFALPWLLKRKAIPYFLLIAIAFSFHHTALIAAPLYLLAAPRSDWRQISLVAFATVLLTVFLGVSVQLAADLLNDRYATYATASSGGGLLTAAFLIFQGAIFFIFKNQVADPKHYYERLLNIYLIGFIPVIAAVASNINPSGLLRLNIYFSYTAILLWPMIFMSIKHQHKRAVFGFIFILFYTAYYAMTTSTFSNLVPYVINGDFI